MPPETARHACFAAYLENCLAPAVKACDEAADRVDRLYGQITLVQACWWLNLSIACEYVDEADAKRFLNEQGKFLSLPAFKELLDVDRNLLPQDLINPLRHGDPRSALSDVVFSRAFDYEKSPAVRSHFQNADEDSWHKALHLPKNYDAIGECLVSRTPPDKSLSGPDKIIVGFMRVLEVVHAIDALFKGMNDSNMGRGVANLESGVKTVLGARIYLSGQRFRDRFLQGSKLACNLFDDVLHIGYTVGQTPKWDSKYEQIVTELVDRWQPEPVRAQLAQTLDY